MIRTFQKSLMLLAACGMLLSGTGARAQSKDGILGITPGEPLSDLSNARGIGHGLYLFDAKNKMDGFTRYVAGYTPDSGVCALTMVSDEYTNDPSGTRVKAAFDKYAKTLQQAYGPGTMLDSADDDVVRVNRPDFWTGELMLKKRRYTGLWGTDEHPLDTLKNINLFVVSDNPYSPRIFLIYYFKNFDACKATVGHL